MLDLNFLFFSGLDQVLFFWLLPLGDILLRSIGGVNETSCLLIRERILGRALFRR